MALLDLFTVKVSKTSVTREETIRTLKKLSLCRVEAGIFYAAAP